MTNYFTNLKPSAKNEVNHASSSTSIYRYSRQTNATSKANTTTSTAHTTTRLSTNADKDARTRQICASFLTPKSVKRRTLA